MNSQVLCRHVEREQKEGERGRRKNRQFKA